MTFSRFQGLGWLWNWSYNNQEEELLKLESRVSEALEGLNAFYGQGRTGARKPPRLQELDSAFDSIRKGTFASQGYAGVKLRLQQLLNELDRLSSQQAILLKLTESFAARSPQTLPEARLLLREAREIATRARLDDIPRMRSLLDGLSQWVSDSLMRAPGSSLSLSLLKRKGDVAQVAAMVQEAFLLGAVKRDYQAAKTRYETACLLFTRSSFEILQAFGTVPVKAREDWDTPFDPGCLMIAALLKDIKFIPDLMVGLPTAGAHAANIIAGALAVLVGRRPVLWYTRPRADKESSQQLFQGLQSSQVFREDEYDYLLDRLRGAGKRGGTLRVLIVDDGAVSGGTLELARTLYDKAFSEDYPKVIVRTATVKGGRGTEWALLPSNKPNTVDYVVNQTDDRVGAPSILRTREDVAARGATFSPGVKLSAEVEIHTSRGQRTVKLGEAV